MKNFGKVLTIALAAVLIAATCLFTASCGKSVEYTFEANGGAAVEAIKVNDGESLNLPVTTKDGYSFEGWYRTADFSGEAVTSIVASKQDKKEDNTTFYAKWEKLYKLTLNADGGNLSVNELYLKEGQNVYDAVKDIVPTKAGLTFGAWYNGQKELNKNLKMSAQGLTLQAKYQVKYTVEIWCETEAGGAYEKTNTIEKSDYVGANVLSEEFVTGYEEIKHSETVTEMALSDKAAENVFKHYFDRNTYTVTFRPNYPDGTTGKLVTETVKFGQGVPVPSQYEFEGYCFVGWATTPNGKVEYYADYISTVLFNKGEQVAADPDVVKPDRNMSLYAVWAKGYEDMFGGDDYIYLFNEDDKVIYLDRGGVFFKGEYNPTTRRFLFVNEKDDVVIEGKLNELNYCYLNEKRASYSAALYVMGQGIDTGVNIYFDSYDGITYSVTNVDGQTTSDYKGTYTVDEYGYYTATFPDLDYLDGDGDGSTQKTIVFVLGQLTVNGEPVPAFQMRIEEEVALGEIPRFGVYENALASYTVGQITLNGFGVASYKTGTNADGSDALTYYYYTLEGDVLSLFNGSNQKQGSFLIKEYNGKTGYVLYDSAMDITATGANGESLTLDGIFSATYVKNGVTINAYYQSTQSTLGDFIVTFKDGATSYTLLVTSETITETVTETNEAGEIVEVERQVVKYYTTEKLAGYAEYRYVTDAKIYIYPIVAFNDKADGKASIYGYNKEADEYKLIATGSYTYSEATKLYTLVIEERFEEDVLTDAFDVTKVASFEFSVNEKLATTPFFFVYDITPVEGEEESDPLTKVYTSAKGGTLTIVAGLIEYSEEGKYWVSTYKADGNIILANNVYFEIDEEALTFITLNPTPYVAYALSEDGNGNPDEYLYFDGKGGAFYTTVSYDEDGKEIVNELKGVAASTGRKTEQGVEIMSFTAEGKNFNYILLSTSQYVFFSPENLNYNGEYLSDDGVLTLDGYGYIGSYTDTDGNQYLGYYFIPEENVVCIIINGGYRYFDVKSDKTFTARGKEYGTYILMDNQAADGYYISLNGYGKLSVYNYRMDENGDLVRGEDGQFIMDYIDENGTYAIDASGKVTLTYKVGETQTVTQIGVLDTYVYGSNAYKTFEVVYEEIATTYVNTKDWSIIILDNHNGAVKYDANGLKETGSYTIITESLFYYVNSNATSAAIYNYNPETFTATPVKLNPFGYYTQELSSLLFSEYGFAIFDGEDRYYYEIIDGQAYIYRRDVDSKDANQYGYVAEKFGEFTDVKEWNGKTYLKASGYALDFKRDDANAEKYPLKSKGTYQGKPATQDLFIKTITFSPAGTEFFTVNGNITIEQVLTVEGEEEPTVTTKVYSCTVSRVLNEETGLPVMYVTLSGYRFEVEMTYIGEKEDVGTELYNGTYTVKGLQYIVTRESDTYYMMYLLASLFGGGVVENDFGTVTFTDTYNEEGDVVSALATGVFGKSSGMLDKNGNIVSFKDLPYTFENNVYTVSIKGEDGSDFKAYFTLSTNPYLGAASYKLVALTRVQTLTDEVSGVTVQVERVVASDSYSPGGIYKVKLLDPEKEMADGYLYEGKVYYVAREKTDNVITKTTYYVISFTEEVVGDDVEGEGLEVVMPYETASVTVYEAETIYVKDSTSRVDVFGGQVGIIYLNGDTYIGIETSYDEATATYTVKVSSTKGFTVKVVENEDGTKNVVIKEIVIEQESEDTNQTA